MRRNPTTIAGLVFLALAAMDAVGTWAWQAGYFDIPLTGFDLASSLISIPLSAAASAGLFLRRLWGWWAAIAVAGLSVASAGVSLSLDPELGPQTLAAMGIVMLITAGLFALLDRLSLRESLWPQPPRSGVFARLPVKGCAGAGVLFLVSGLLLSVVVGWLILLLTAGILLIRRARRRAQAHAA